ncbi:T9SS type A sorting domain-containing protein [Tenacibaculum maritimum]|uniref:T9SS type A sorting domain-containing protein n=1 Tax=Tenacibaculum maritimum TaxID=107401 RepID=UPI0012E52716|nr:T9SS type A sorting domain-containing protein [Tenacibaculum maritimum]CAA0182501.1 Protein of unknown function precursor containing a C-terminal secretion signal [Tenacibaculum maritimum]CAA0200236.1 Protein of unknown function precursor containing a C-terminal secretion signal [Tenacibaculum maritimum]
MIKKILFISFLLITSLSFSQKTVKNLSAAPNPFRLSTMISFDSENDQVTIIDIKNILGKTIYRKVFTAKKGRNSFFLSRNNLKAGMYICAIQNSKDMVSKRLVIR